MESGYSLAPKDRDRSDVYRAAMSLGPYDAGSLHTCVSLQPHVLRFSLFLLRASPANRGSVTEECTKVATAYYFMKRTKDMDGNK